MPLPPQPETRTPLQDPALTVGTLPNGLRYYIRTSTSPAKRAHLWLAVNAGAIQEDDDQRGFAHFLEHMAFNGTTHFPKNTLIDFVEHAGMQFGGDLNAYTSFDETVYQLTIPTDDRKTLSDGLQVVQDWANGGITIDSTEVVGERGVVLGEWRSRNPDTATRRVRDHQIELLVGPDSRYLRRFPIGLPTLLRSAQSEPIRRFYRDWYRPDLMAFIAVGDFDPSDMEREIRARFGSIPAPQNPRAFVRPQAPKVTEAVVHVVKDKVRPRVDVTWPIPALAATPDAALRHELLERLMFQNIQRTLTHLSRQTRRPFAGAGIGRAAGQMRSLGDSYTVQIVANPDSLLSGLAAVLTEIERIAQHGIPTRVLEGYKASLLRQLEQANDAATAVPSVRFARQYVQHYLRGEGYLLSPQQELRLARQILPSLTSETIAHAARFWRSGTPPTVTVMLPMYASVNTPTRAGVVALLDSVANNPIPSGVQTRSHTESSRPLLTTPPTPGRITAERRFGKAEVTVWTLSNGARVIYKQTSANPDEVIVHALSLGGFSRLPDSLFFSSGRYVASLMTAAGGVGVLDRDALIEQLNTTALQTFRVSIDVFQEEIVVGGSPRELETLFQLTYLQFTEPKVDSVALAEWKRYGAGTLTMSPNDQLAVSSSSGEGQRRLVRPSAGTIPFIDLQQAMAVYRDRFGDASDFTFAIVGAAPQAQIKPLVERYLASLPSSHRVAREEPMDYSIPPWTRKMDVRAESPSVPPEKAGSTLTFDGLVSGTREDVVREQTRLRTLSWILGRRLRNRLREEMAVTYGVSAPVEFYENPAQHYRLTINVLTAPEQIDSSVAAIWKIIDEITAHGVTADELSSAAIVAQRSTENARQSNQWWSAQLQRYDRFGMSLDEIADAAGVTITSRDVQAAAARYLPKKVYVQKTVLPTAKNIREYQNDSTAER